jgi:hypothetical protein
MLDERDLAAPADRPAAGGAAPSVPPAGGGRRFASAVAAVCAVLGVALRAYAATHSAINSDEAVAGLVADGILHGHFVVFYPGQVYGGVEPYAVAVMFAVFGHGPVVLQATGAVLAAATAVVTWRVALRLVEDRRIALLAGAFVWIAPEAAVFDSTLEYGFRNVSLLAGVLVLLFALRILDGRSRRPLLDVAVLGLVAGVGWWSSEEIVYFLIPGAALVAGAAWPARRAGRRHHGAAPAAAALVAAPAAAVFVAAFVVGAAPWLYDNVRSHLASLRPSSLHEDQLTYAGRLRIFLHLSGPMELNLRDRRTGDWLTDFPGHPGLTTAVHDGLLGVVALLVVGALVVCCLRVGRATALAVAVVAFPFVYAAVPATWFWQDGRYAVYLAPLLILVIAVAADRLGRLRRARPHCRTRRFGAGATGVRDLAVAGLAVVVVVSAVCTVDAFHRDTGAGASDLTSGWHAADRADRAAIHHLEALGLTAGFASYWVAYDVDFLSRRRLDIATAGTDPDRDPAVAAAAAVAPHPVWLFAPPFNGPAGQLEAQLTAHLRSLGVGYRVFHWGQVTCVAPASRVTPEQVGEPADAPPN